MKIIKQLSDISDQFDAVFCDVWGCIHNGVNAFSESCQSLKKFRIRGGTSLLLTNAPRPWQDVEAHLNKLGISSSVWDAILTSGDAAKFAMFEGCVGHKIYHIGPKRDVGFFHPVEIWQKEEILQVGLEDAEGIVCTGLFDDETETPEDYRSLLERAKKMDLPFLCANPDVIVDRGENRVFCAGALAQLYTELGGKVLMFGKPHNSIYDLARRKLQQLRQNEIPNSRILCIGDGLTTDLEGAVRQKLPSLFVSGGLYALETDTQDDPNPEKLNNFFKQNGIYPNYVVGRLR